MGHMTEEEKSTSVRMVDKVFESQKISQKIVNIGQGGIFFQFPYLPTDSGFFEWASEPNRQIIEDFWEIPNPICDIHWWGEYLLYDGAQWHFLDPEQMKVDILFFEEDNGRPGKLVGSYLNVKPSVIPTGLWYDYGDPHLWQLYYFEYNLDPCVNLINGWVSIYSVTNNDNGWFMWMTSPDGNGIFLRNESGSIVPYSGDVALVLTDGEPSNPDLECEGGIRKTEVPPGSNISGSFQVRNNGDVGSILHWKIDESTIPGWGDNWVFSPNASILTTDMGWITVDVEFQAPSEENEEYNETIRVLNAAESSDYCEIDIYIKTPRIRTTYNKLLLQLLERFPNVFSLLRQLIGLI
jgi:hypothetical protein